MSKWNKPIVVSDLDVMFGGNVFDKVPKWEEIPQEFRDEKGPALKWTKVVNDMFFKGVKDIRMIVKKPEIDQKLAMRHLTMILHSYNLPHEHKVAGVSYLLSLWLDDITYTCLEEV